MLAEWSLLMTHASISLCTKLSNVILVFIFANNGQLSNDSSRNLFSLLDVTTFGFKRILV